MRALLLSLLVTSCADERPGDGALVDEDIDGGPVTPADYDDCGHVDAWPASFTDESGLFEREGSVGFLDYAGREVRAFTYRASGYAPSTGAILFAIHGAERDPGVLVDALAPVAEREGALVIAPYFDEDIIESVEGFTLGIGVGGVPAGQVYDPARWRAPEAYVFSEIEHLFEAARARLGSPACDYLLAGVAEGGEFVHRALLFRPDARIRRAAAVNTGWYTLPSDGSGDDPAYYVPYGLQGSPVTGAELGAAFGRELVLLVGERNSGWPGGPDAAASQGDDAMARARTFLSVAEAASARMEVSLAWSRAEMGGVDDGYQEVGPDLGWWLFHERGDAPCEPATSGAAGGLVINEVFADPDRGLDGDANNDGTSHADEDEFVELLNTGDAPLCLQGWSLSDADSTRHVFPVATWIGAGEALVVFGGGAPVGDFGGAGVQWAALDGELSLSSGGDVVRLADAGGFTVREVSWGDCGDRDCSPDYMPVALYEEQSATRDPDGSGVWRLHQAASRGRLFSPGTRSDGRGF